MSHSSFKTTHKYGICIASHGDRNGCSIFGAGTGFYAGGDDFGWVDKWKTVKAGKNWETTFTSDGDVSGIRNVFLPNRSVELCMDEDGCGVISYKRGKYIWVQHAD